MLRYTTTKQIEIFEFAHPFQTELDPENRWVKLSNLLPWDELVGIYSRSLSRAKGKYGIEGRLAVGSLIIKHKLQLSDREVIETLKENIYLQYFVGFKGFQKKAAFDASLFVELRKRMGSEKFDEMNREIIDRSEEVTKDLKAKTTINKKDKAEKPGSVEVKGNEQRMPEPTKHVEEVSTEENKTEAKAQQDTLPNKGKLKIDATVSDQMIVYPTDVGLLNRAREESESLIDFLYKESGVKIKPRTYRREARKAYLSISKKKNKTRKEIRKAIGKQLRYLRRNIKHIHKMLDMFEGKRFPLNKRDQRIFWVIQLLYSQQEQMYRKKGHSVENRIVNIYQPYVRPIPRGKEKATVEFGAKLGVSEVDGYVRINKLSWEAYNESSDLKKQVEDYREQYGYYPEVVLADKIYLSRENRQHLQSLGIRVSGKPLGRPQANESYYQKAKRRKENAQRNHIEGKFGQGKNAYGLSRIRARRQDTSESWIAAIFFVMNIVKLVKTANIFFYFISLAKKIQKVITDIESRNKTLAYATPQAVVIYNS
jgi:IS5 family transposase